MNPSYYERVPKVASVTIDTMHCLLANFEPFSKGIKKHIQCVSSLARIEQFMKKDIPSKELIDYYNIKKAQFDITSQLHT